MKKKMISQALDLLDDRHISVTSVFMQEAVKRDNTMRKTSQKRFISILIAACLVLSMAVVAYAVSSIHQQRQAEIRDFLKIEEGNVKNYAETQVDADVSAGLTILSCVNDGESNKVFVNVSPVTEDELQSFPNELNLFWKAEGTELWGYAGPHISSTESLSGEKEIRDAVLSGAYDADTQTLTLVCYVDNELLKKEMGEEDHIMLSVGMNLKDQEIRRFGPVPFSPAEPEIRSFDFGFMPYYSAELDKEIRLVSLELSPFSAVWRTDYENARKYSEELNYEMMDQWNSMQDLVCMETRIIFSDGSQQALGGALSCPYENGTDNAYCSWAQAVDISAVEQIILGDTVIWEK